MQASLERFDILRHRHLFARIFHATAVEHILLDFDFGRLLRRHRLALAPLATPFLLTVLGLVLRQTSGSQSIRLVQGLLNLGVAPTIVIQSSIKSLQFGELVNQTHLYSQWKKACRHSTSIVAYAQDMPKQRNQRR